MPSITQLLIILVIAALVFGTKRFRDAGGDIGAAIKSFKKAVKEDPVLEAKDKTVINKEERIIEHESEK